MSYPYKRKYSSKYTPYKRAATQTEIAKPKYWDTYRAMPKSDTESNDKPSKSVSFNRKYTEISKKRGWPEDTGSDSGEDTEGDSEDELLEYFRGLNVKLDAIQRLLERSAREDGARSTPADLKGSS